MKVLNFNFKGQAIYVFVAVAIAVIIALFMLYIINSQTGFINYGAMMLTNIIVDALSLKLP